MLFNERLQIGVTIHRGVVARHHVSDAHATQTLGDCYLRLALAGSTEQEPADEGDPQTAKACAAEESQHAKNDKAEGDDLTDARSDSRRALCITRDPPDDGPQNAPPVERKARDHVEDRQHDVDVAEPHQHRGQGSRGKLWRRPPQRVRYAQTDDADH